MTVGAVIKKQNDFSRMLTRIWNEFVYGGHFHSIGVACLVLSSSIVIGSPAPFSLFVIIYAGVQSGYLYNRYIEYEIDMETNPDRTKHIGRYLNNIPTIIVTLTALIIFLFIRYGNVLSLLYGLILFIVGLAYSLFIKKITQKIIGLKNYFVALSFSSLLLLYAIYTNHILSVSLWIMLIVILIRVFSNTIFFDLKDIKSDMKEGLKTIPVLLGKKKSYIMLYVLNVLSLLPIIIGIICNIIPIYSSSLLLLALYVVYYLNLARKSNNNIAEISYIYADGEYIVWLLLVGGSSLLV
ncbi:MAG: UbiA family prenyltransferase [Candidatus Saccharibacteria bacterium]